MSSLQEINAELLEALKKTLHWAERWCDGDCYFGEEHPDITSAKLAIANAEKANEEFAKGRAIMREASK